MNPFTRNLVATILGLLIGSAVNMLIVIIGSRLVPPPAGVDMADSKSIAESVHLLRPSHFIFPFLAHALGTFVGAFIACRLAHGRRAAYAYVVGGLFLVGGIAAVTMIPAPGWFVAVDLGLAYIPMAFLAAKVAQRVRGEPGPVATNESRSS